jgi:hypothetical protein
MTYCRREPVGTRLQALSQLNSDRSNGEINPQEPLWKLETVNTEK